MEIIFFPVDDVILCGSPEFLKKVIHDIKNKLEINDLGFPTEVLGIQIRRNSKALYLSTEKNERRIITEFEINHAKRLRTPSPTGLKLAPLNEISDPLVIPKNRKLPGNLPYISRCVRFDICYAVNFLSRYSSNHNTTIWNLLKRKLRYLQENQIELQYAYASASIKQTPKVAVRSDASFADEATTRKSTIGHIIFWNGYTVAWNSTKTSTVPLSTCEAEFFAPKKRSRQLYICAISTQKYSKILFHYH